MIACLYRLVLFNMHRNTQESGADASVARIPCSRASGARIGRFSAPRPEYRLEKGAPAPTIHVDVRRIR